MSTYLLTYSGFVRVFMELNLYLAVSPSMEYKYMLLVVRWMSKSE